jgi:uncharacterized membrane protein
MKNIIVFLSISIASGILFVNLYTSLIDAKSWGTDIPSSIAAAREYFRAVKPGDYFRIFSPLNQVVGLVALILFWKSSPSIRLCLGAAFALYVLGDILTFAYFYPRNDIMFKDAQLTDVALLKKVWSEWTFMNWVRSFMILVGLTLSCLSLHKIYSAH